MNGQGDEFHKLEDIYDRLEQDAREQPVKDDIMAVKNETDTAEARELVNRVIFDGLTTAADLARRTGIKPAAISAFRNDKWGKGSPGTLLTTASELAKAVNAILRKQRAEETKIDGFVQTRVAEAIFNLVQYAVKRGMIAAFVIPAGAGKTITLQQLAEDTPGAMLLTVTRTRSTPKSFLQVWARALGMDEHGSAQDIQDSIINRMVRSDRLVLIDEAHKLQVSALDAIREVYDEAKVPIVLAGTPSLYTTLTTRRVGSVASELLDQLYSRIGLYRDLSDLVDVKGGDDAKLYNREDIRRVFARGKVRIARDGVEFLMRLANHPGSGCLRICRDLCQIVVDLFPGREITAELLEKAYKMKAGVREAGFRIGAAWGLVEQEPEAAAAAG